MAYRAPFCSRKALTRRTPCGLVRCTETGVVTPTNLTAGLTLSPVWEDVTRSAMVATTRRHNSTRAAFTVPPRNRPGPFRPILDLVVRDVSHGGFPNATSPSWFGPAEG